MLGWFKKAKSAEAGDVIRAPQLPLDLLDADFVADPYPTYAWLRINQPVVELAGGGYLVTRHRDIIAAFTNPSLGNAPSRFSTLAAKNAEKYVAADLASHIPPFLDGDAHREMRQMVTRAFFNTFKELGDDLDELARVYVGDLNTFGDLIAGVSQPFAVQAMCRFCGINAKTKEMKRLTQSFFHLFAPLRDPKTFEHVNASLTEFRELIANALNSVPPAGSFLSELKTFQSANPSISDEHIIDNCLLVFADGVENVEAGAASALMVFERFGVTQSIACGELSLDVAAQEALRLETPAQLVPRVAKENCVIAGVSIRKDLPVFLALASGNRDETVFQNPNSFDVKRDPKSIMTFGQVRHRCIGEPLAMAQIRALLNQLIAAKVMPDDLNCTYQARLGHRWPERLMVRKR